MKRTAATRRTREGCPYVLNATRALEERVKELSCLYGMSQLAAQLDESLDAVLQGVVDLIPAAWQYPAITVTRLRLEGREYRSRGYRDGGQKLTAAVPVAGGAPGVLEVAYHESRPECDEGPFLREERSLIDAIAKQVGLVIERHQAREERNALQQQLLHADRLATIGQLAAGVAHELNEPLSSILGFAQLLARLPDLPAAAVPDLDKIVKASLHAREIIRKLLLFARQSPGRRRQVQLNTVVAEALALFEHRLRRDGVEIASSLDPCLPEIMGDPGQLTQVLVNIITNALQAMPEGGTLALRTGIENGCVVCEVEDTGIGMSEDILGRIFVPFFTTKGVNQGTGLGLPVVHGIVTAHRGTIGVRSVPGQGSVFTIRLPLPGSEEPSEERHAS
ncbi:MAG: PAS domain-containing sensor histidine kinase [Lentisphaeria bacterium]|nr:PAS domain-containing sensor histidine kinase [Lentisphaeria bacterium]